MKWQQIWCNNSSFYTFYSIFNRFNPFHPIFFFVHFHPFLFITIFGIFCFFISFWTNNCWWNDSNFLMKWHQFSTIYIFFSTGLILFNLFFVESYPVLSNAIFGMFCFLFQSNPAIIDEMRTILVKWKQFPDILIQFQPV